MSGVTFGTRLRWYEINGWIPQGGGQDYWTRYGLHLLGVRLLKTPWIYCGPLDKPRNEIRPPAAK